MYPARFDYYRAASVDEAVSLLGEHPGAKLLAGGHSLLPLMKLRLAEPPALIDVGRIDELKGVSREGGTVYVGALTTHSELASSQLLDQTTPLLAEAASKIGDPQVRNKGTVGGNVAHADPGSDLPAVLLALGATFVAYGAAGERRIAAADFFDDLLTCALEVDEVLTGIEVPTAGEGAGFSYQKCEHPASGYALCGAAAGVRDNLDGSYSQIRLCFNGVTATPLDASGVAAALEGSDLSDDAIGAALAGLELADALGDIHASAEYREQLARTYGARALKTARDRA